jgi:hypothetical protein
MPAAMRLIRPARSMSWWLITSASAGVSLVVEMGKFENRINVSYEYMKRKSCCEA